jgi:hypothetical protein
MAAVARFTESPDRWFPAALHRVKRAARSPSRAAGSSGAAAAGSEEAQQREHDDDDEDEQKNAEDEPPSGCAFPRSCPGAARRNAQGSAGFSSFVTLAVVILSSFG